MWFGTLVFLADDGSVKTVDLDQPLPVPGRWSE